MFYCGPCRVANAWPKSIATSYGKCEICARMAECWDYPSRLLPLPLDKRAKALFGDRNANAPDVIAQTYYLDWQRISATDPGKRDLATILVDTGTPSWLEVCGALWRQGLYAPGESEDFPAALDHTSICERLFSKYNHDSRPDRKTRRSISIGDVVQIGTSYYICRTEGWEAFSTERVTHRLARRDRSLQ